MEELEKKYIVALLKEFGGSRQSVARTLKLSERTLYRKLHEHSITGSEQSRLAGTDNPDSRPNRNIRPNFADPKTIA